MKKFLLIIALPVFLFSQIYMTKIEPYEEYIIYSQTSGQIVNLDKNDETKIVNKVLIKLDDTLEQKQLKIYKNQLELNKQKLKIYETSYKKFVKIRGKSQSDKDDKYSELLDIRLSIDSLKLSIEELKDIISKKTIKINNLYVKNFLVDKGDYVSTGAQLATVQDISKSKLIVYVSASDYKDIKNKKIYLDDKISSAYIEKIDKTLDETYVSAHKVTIVLDNKKFGKVTKVEFKYE
ncbi:HlyD family efflux transporter periplasmic adaptor subunit [Campylobacterota bacterium DY0563]